MPRLRIPNYLLIHHLTSPTTTITHLWHSLPPNYIILSVEKSTKNQKEHRNSNSDNMKYTAVLSLLFAGAALADLPYHMPDPAAKRQEGLQPPPIWSGLPTGTGGLPPPPPQGTGGAWPPHHGSGGPHSHSHTHSHSSSPSSSSVPRNQHHHQPGSSSSWAVPTGTGYFPGGPGPTGAFSYPGHGHSTLRTHTVPGYPTGTGSASLPPPPPSSSGLPASSYSAGPSAY